MEIMFACVFSGVTPEGFKLKMVQVFFRHGDRMSFKSFTRKTNPAEKSCFVNTSLFGNDDILQRYVTTMTAFTGKQPTGSFFENKDIFPNYTVCPSGGLTGIGVAQLVRLGQYFRQKYLTQLSGMFSNEISLTSQIYAISTRWSRTYQSLTAFLFGLLEQTEFNLTKLYTARSDRNLCLKEGYYKRECKFFRAKNFSSQFHVSRLRKEYRRNSANISFPKRGNFQYFVEVIGFTYCHTRPKVCLPHNSTTCFTLNDFNKIWEHFYRENRYVQEHSPDIKYFYAAYYAVMTQIVDQMYNRIINAEQTKFVVYSNHDTQLLQFLKVFGIDGIWIRYAGRIVIELFESNIKNEQNKDIQDQHTHKNGWYNETKNHFNNTESHFNDIYSQNRATLSRVNNKHKHYIKFFYDGKDFTESVTFCKGRTFRGLCEFSLLYDFVYKEMRQEIKKIDQ